MARRIEWPTVAVILGCYSVWALAIGPVAAVSIWLAVPLAALAITLHSSLRHEAIHGHPSRWPLLNAALVFPALDLLVPWGRFRDTHLAHHHDECLTDPYDDPETQYLDPAVWARLPGWRRAVLRANATLAGRLLLGPAVGMAGFLRADLAAMRAGVPGVLAAWLWHLPGAVLVLAVVTGWGAMPLWAYGVAVYMAMAVLKLRTFLEHRAHLLAPARTAIVEDRGPLAFLFLNNNLHLVHHLHPGVAWYDLPRRYGARKAEFQARNQGYVYRSYAQVAARYALSGKEPVAHPFYASDSARQPISRRQNPPGQSTASTSP